MDSILKYCWNHQIHDIILNRILYSLLIAKAWKCGEILENEKILLSKRLVYIGNINSIVLIKLSPKIYYQYKFDTK